MSLLQHLKQAHDASSTSYVQSFGTPFQAFPRTSLSAEAAVCEGHQLTKDQMCHDIPSKEQALAV